MNAFPVRLVSPDLPRPIGNGRLVLAVDPTGPFGDDVAVTLWSWDRAAARPYRVLSTTSERVTETSPGVWAVAWTDDAGDHEGTVDRDPICPTCGNPMAHWHPPGARQTFTTGSVQWGTAATDGTNPIPAM